MSVRVGLVVLAILVLPVVQASGARAAVPQGAVEFQDGSGSSIVSVMPDQRVRIYVKDETLGSLDYCIATWTNLPATVPANQPLSLSTGAPHPDVYELNEGCLFDRQTPSNTPIIISSGDTADVNGVPTLVCCPDWVDQVTLNTNADAGNTIEFEFIFDQIDSYDASAKRVRVFSESDPSGEWIAIAEVASETDASPAPKSSLFLGEVTLSPDPQSSEAGDGTVWGQSGYSLETR